MPEGEESKTQNLLDNYSFDLSLDGDQSDSYRMQSELNGTEDEVDNLLAELQELVGSVAEVDSVSSQLGAPDSSYSDPISPYQPLATSFNFTEAQSSSNFGPAVATSQASLEIGKLNLSNDEKHEVFLRSKTSMTSQSKNAKK